MSYLWRNKQGVEYIFFRSTGIIGKYQKNQQKNRFFSKNGYKEGNRECSLCHPERRETKSRDPFGSNHLE